MNGNVSLKALLGWLVALVPFVALCVSAWQGDHEGSLISFFAKLPIFTVQIIGILAVALLAVFISQAVRNLPRFDVNGAANQMAKCRLRMGTDLEKPGDPIACGLQYFGTTILLAIVLLSFFLIHGK